MTTPALCPEKAILLDAYEQATGAHYDAVSTLRRTMGVLAREEYERAYEKTEELRLAAREAHDILVRHVILHGC